MQAILLSLGMLGIASIFIRDTEDDNESLDENNAIEDSLDYRQKHPTLVHGPSKYFKEDARDTTPRLKFINLIDKHVKFKIRTIPWSRYMIKMCKCMIPTPGGSIAVEGEIEQKNLKDNEVRLAPISKMHRQRPDICEFPIPSRIVYVSMFVEGLPVFMDRKMKAYDTFICRQHIEHRAMSTPEYVCERAE